MMTLPVVKLQSFLTRYAAEQIRPQDDEVPLVFITKGNTGYHGYGLNSIPYTSGHVNVQAENGWFSLKILIPLKTSKS